MPLVRRPALVAALLVAALAGLLTPGLAAAAPRTEEPALVTFGVGPAGATRADGRALFRYTVPAGGVLRDHVAVVNLSPEPLTLLVYPSDAVTSGSGGLEIRERAVRNARVGAWITLGDAVQTGRLDPTARSTVQVTVPPQRPGRGPGQVLLPMRIAVPADVSPGDHVGGIAVALVAKGSGAGAQTIDLEQRVVSRIYLDVPGRRAPGLDVDILRTDYVGGAGLGLRGMLDVTYRVRNTGNVRLGATTSLTAAGPFGLGGWDASGQRVDELLPRSEVVLVTRVPGVWPTILGTVRVTAKAVAAPASDAPRLAPVSDSARYWAVTWQEIAALMVLLAVVLYRRWRRARRPGKVTDGPPALELVGAATVALVVLVAVLAALPGRAQAATTLGTVEVSPTVGTDQTLFDGAVAQARCPRGTGDSFFTVDGPGLEPNTAFLGFGNRTGTGFQSFAGATIANIRTASTGAFQTSGSYHVRFSCVRASDGVVTGSYTRRLDYEAGGGGSWRFAGYPRTGPTRPPLPTPAASRSAGPAAVGPGAAATPDLRGWDGRSAPTASASPVTPRPSASAPVAAGATSAADEARGADRRSLLWPVLTVVVAVVAGGAIIRRTRRARSR
jgi:hypothetical protein